MSSTNVSQINGKGDSGNLEKDFISLILKVQGSLAQYGVEKEAFSGLNCFKGLDLPTQNEVLESLKSYHQVIESIREVDGDMEDDLRFIWSALKTYSLVPPSDFLETYRKGSIFEIYDSRGQQVFRNFEFFSVTSYSLEQIFCLPWFQAYTRDEKITEVMLDIVTKIYTDSVTERLIDPVPSHLIQEIQSDFENLIEITITSIVPLKFKSSPDRRIGVFSMCEVIKSKENVGVAELTEKALPKKPFLHLID